MPLDTSFGTVILLKNALFVVFIVAAFSNFTYGIISTVCLLFVLRYYRLKPLKFDTVCERLGFPQGEDNSLSLSPILHRGGNVHFPENTLEGIKKLEHSSAHGVEVDLAFTSDGVGVLFHDLTVERTTDGSGYLADMTFESVSSLDAAFKHPCRDASGCLKIPSLEECLETCMKLDLMVYIDCKTKPRQTADLLCSLFKKYPKLYKKAVVCSFFPPILYAVRKSDPEIMTGQTMRHAALQYRLDHDTGKTRTWWQALLAPVVDVLLEWSLYSWMWYLCGNSFTLICKDDLSRETCNYFRNLGTLVIPWTVNEEPEKDFFQRSLKCPVMTDYIDIGVYSSESE